MSFKYCRAAHYMADAARLDTEPFFESNDKLHSRLSEVKFSSLTKQQVQDLQFQLNMACEPILKSWCKFLVKKAVDELPTEA